MNINEVRSIIRQTIAEAMAEKGEIPKSGGKLKHLKIEMEGLKKMKESLGQYQISEGSDQQFVAEYAHMQKFFTEYNKIKEAHARLSEMLDNQISEVDNRIKTETEKIKEMMGLIEKAPKKPAAKKDDKKAAKKDDKKEDDKKKAELDEARFEKGEDVGKPGKGFTKIAKSAAKQYGSKEAGQKVAGAILKKVVAK